MARMFRMLAASAAALSLIATPVAAMDLPAAGPVSMRAYDGDAGNVERHRRHRHRDRVDAGDVLTGVLILGGIAAIASAASKPRASQARYPESRPRYAEPARVTGQGMDRAVDMCVDAVEYEQGRVTSVDGANRTGDGWQVTGELARGAGFSCWIDRDGQVSGIDVVGQGYDGAAYGPAAYEPVEDNQWDDATYARARAAVGGQSGYPVAGY